MLYCKHLRIITVHKVRDEDEWNGLKKYKNVYSWKSSSDLNEEEHKTFEFEREYYKENHCANPCEHCDAPDEEFIECDDQCL